jgi:hypothetical protein
MWRLAFGLVVLYVAVRMGALALSADVVTPGGTARLPNTFASVDHPFHAARAGVLWRELASGSVPRWIGQHQGGYPVEFYPLGEAWLEVVVRGLSLGQLPAESAHTLAIIGLFLAPGAAFAAMTREDGWSPAVALIAFVLHIALPGGWYHGGYTELVQWGLVTNVAGAVAALCMMPAIVRFLGTGAGWSGATAAALAAVAIYCNPRSLLALIAIWVGAWFAAVFRNDGGAPLRTEGDGGRLSPPEVVVHGRRDDAGVGRPRELNWELTAAGVGAISIRLAQVAVVAALLAAPELTALARFRDLYTFVQYSGYSGLIDYALMSANAVTWPVLALGLLGLIVGLLARQRQATTSSAAALLLYLVLTASLVVIPAAAGLAPQLEPTRLMPIQRFLTLYLAAVGFWTILSWAIAKNMPSRPWVAPVLAAGAAAAMLLVQTRALDGPLLDPASPVVPAVSLYPVPMSAQPEQADLQEAIRAADKVAPSGTALLVLGSALSWHQQLWAPLWTTRPLFYDNWLWYWQPDHGGTPGYAFRAGHHYPDPQRTLERDYLARHGIGAVAVTGPTREAAAQSPLLQPVREGVYDVYSIVDPVTAVTFGEQNAVSLELGDRRIVAVSAKPGTPVTVRVNWYPRWYARGDDDRVAVDRLSDGYIGLTLGEPISQAELVYSVQPLDWAARLLSLIGLAGLAGLTVRRRAIKQSMAGSRAFLIPCANPSSPAFLSAPRGEGRSCDRAASLSPSAPGRVPSGRRLAQGLVEVRAGASSTLVFSAAVRGGSCARDWYQRVMAKTVAVASSARGGR